MSYIGSHILARELKKGSAELLILSLVEERPRHGYDIGSLIEQRSHGALRFNVASLYPLLYRLEKRGWMSRTPDPQDGRATLAVLTEQGWGKVVATAPGHASVVQRLVFDHLSSADVRHLRRVTERILQAAKPDVCLSELPTAP